MLRYTRWDDDEPEDWGGGWDGDEDHEGDDEEDGDDTVPCPYCHQPVHEDAEWCPHCESYISAEDAPPARKPWWIIVGALACLAVVYVWVTGP